MTDRQDITSEWSVLREKLAAYCSVYEGPIPSVTEVNTIPDAPICGGGRVTVAVDSKRDEVHYHLSKSDFWAIKPMPEMLFQKHHIRQVPLCRLALNVHNAAAESEGLRHVQDMSNAEIRSVFPLTAGVLNVRCVALAQQDMVVYELEAVDGPAAVTATIGTENENGSFFIIKGHEDNDTVWLRKEHTSFITVNAAVAMRAVGASNVRSVYEQGFQTALSFDVQPGQPARLLVCIKGGKDAYHHLENALAALEMDGQDARPTGEGESIDEMLAAHTEWWKDFWLRCWVDLNDPLLERYYYGAQYVHGCSIDLGGRVVPGLAGGWITNDAPIWGGTYTMNYNGESPFWGLASSNRGEWLLPYARVCLDYIQPGRALAKRLDTKGIVMPVMIGPWGIPDNDDALGQKSNASMAALSLIWHYESTRDRKFLEEILYPYLRELMDFWEDNLELDESGRYIIIGSARERNPGDLNPSEDLAYVRRILDVMIPASRELGRDGDRRDAWLDYQARLSDYPVANEDGNFCFKEAENRMKISHHGVGDNVCALNAVYPGGGIDHDPSGKGKIIARNTLRYLKSWNQANSFTRVFPQAVRAEWPGDDLMDRFEARIGGAGEGAHEHLRRNNTFLPADHSFEGTAPTEFINSMLAHAHGDVLKVFHVWPKARDASFHRIRVRGAFLISGEVRGGEVTHVQVVSERGGPCRMQSCWPGRGIRVESIDTENTGDSARLTDMECGDGLSSVARRAKEEVTAFGAAERQGCRAADVDSSDTCRVTEARAPRLGKAAISSPHSKDFARDDSAGRDVYTWDTEPGGIYRVIAGEAVAADEANFPVMLVPVIDPAVRAEEKHTDADLDVLLTPEATTTQLEIDAVYADESRRRCTHECRFAVCDEQIAQVDADAVLSGVGRGRTIVDVVAEIDGVNLTVPISVYVLSLEVITDVTATVAPQEGRSWDGKMNTPGCLVMGYGMDGPDVTSLARANSYRFGNYSRSGNGEDAWIQFDLGSIHDLDEMWVWNYNCPDNYRVLWWNGGTACGMRDVTIEYSEDGQTWTELSTEGYPFRLAKATGKQWMPATNLDDGAGSPICFEGARARYVRIAPDAATGVGNWGGEHIGLSQVRFTQLRIV
ncbi:MAG: hypothetical protein HN341_09440 [Verrucomicrobia bacterium]|nr:hypothetical protein [Verrucomicrobiota bacterium]